MENFVKNKNYEGFYHNIFKLYNYINFSKYNVKNDSFSFKMFKYVKYYRDLYYILQTDKIVDTYKFFLLNNSLFLKKYLFNINNL
jgi:hypothetical protein